MSGTILGESAGALLIPVSAFDIGATGDTSVPIPYSSYVVRGLTLYGASASLAATSALVSLRTASGGGGSAIVNGQAPTALTAATVVLDATLALTTVQTATVLFLRVVQGLTPTAGTCKAVLEIQPLP